MGWVFPTAGWASHVQPGCEVPLISRFHWLLKYYTSQKISQNLLEYSIYIIYYTYGIVYIWYTHSIHIYWHLKTCKFCKVKHLLIVTPSSPKTHHTWHNTCLVLIINGIKQIRCYLKQLYTPEKKGHKTPQSIDHNSLLIFTKCDRDMAGISTEAPLKRKSIILDLDQVMCFGGSLKQNPPICGV